MKPALLLGLAGLLVAGATSSAFLPAIAESSGEAGGSDSTSTTEEATLKERVWDALSDLYSSSNYTMEWDYLGHTYQDIVTENYIFNGLATGAYVKLPSYNGAYDDVVYSAVMNFNANGSKDVELGSVVTASGYRFFPGDTNLGSSAARLGIPETSLESYDPLSETNGHSHSEWGGSITSDKIVDIADGVVGVLSNSWAISSRATGGLYFTMCARLGFYNYTSTYRGMRYTGRFYRTANAASTSGTRPAAVAFDFDTEGNLVASILLTATDGTYYVPQFGSATFKNIGTTSDEAFEEVLKEGAGNISKISLSHSEARNISGPAFSSNTTITSYSEQFGEVEASSPYTYYLDYNGSYLRSYNEDNLEGNLFQRTAAGGADYILLTGDNQVTHYDNGDEWLDWSFAYEWFEPGAWRYIASSDTYRYYGFDGEMVYQSLTGTSVPGYQSSGDLGIQSLDIKITDGKVSHLTLVTGTATGATSTGPMSIWIVAETEILAEARSIEVPVPFERDESYDAVKAAFDLNNDMTSTFKTEVVESFSGMYATALHRHITYSPTVVYHDEILDQSSTGGTYRREIFGYYYREGSGMIPFEMDVDSGEVTASGPTVADETIADYWGTISASPDIMTYNSTKTGFVLKGNVHLLPSYFPTVTGSDSGEEDAVSDVAITMGEGNEMNEITYMAGADFGSYGTANVYGSIKYDWDATLPEGLLTKLAAMEEFVPPASWTESACYSSTLQRYMNNYITSLNSITGGSVTADDIPYIYDSGAEEYGSGAFSSYGSNSSGYFYFYIYSSRTDTTAFLENYIAHLLSEGYQKFTGNNSNAYEMYGKDYIYIRPYLSYGTCYVYFYLPGKGGTPSYPDVPAYEA